jgi:hypothetical protein
MENGIFLNTNRARTAFAPLPSPNQSEPVKEAPMADVQDTATSDTIKLCECGCGKPAPIATTHNKTYGHIKGRAVRYIRGHASKPRPREPFIGPLEPGTRMVPLTQGMYAKVDEGEYDRLAQNAWVYTAHGYAARKPNQSELIPMHREIMSTPPGMVADHINGNRLDNRRANLRNCTHAENCRNRGAHVRQKTSQYKGVYRDKSADRWYACARFNKKRYWLGTFYSEEEAARAYDAKAKELYGDFARLNFND